MTLRRVTFTPAVSTSIYAAGDVLFITTEVVGALVKEGARGILRAVTVHDKDDEAANLTLYFLRSNVSLGALNDPISISDADCVNLTGAVLVDSWFDTIANQQGFKSGLEIPLEGDGTDRSIFVAATTAGTPTYAAATDLVIDLWIEDQFPQ